MQFPGYGRYSIAVTSEEMGDGKWAAVATITHSTARGQRAIDLPVPAEHFEREEDAEHFAVDSARKWIEENLPAESGREDHDEPSGQR